MNKIMSILLPRREHRARQFVIALACAICAAALTAGTAAAAENFTWSGTASVGSAEWSSTANWEGGKAPNGSVGTLTFPSLTSPACTANPPTATCYTSTNDVAGLNVNAISINDATSYTLSGNAITLGSGGLTVSTSAFPSFAELRLPITLGAPQTWSINGPTGGGTQSVDLESGVTGPGDTLNLQTANGGGLLVESDVEVGTTTISGEGPGVLLGTRAASASLNGTNGNSVNLSGGVFAAFNGTVGALTLAGRDEIQVGEIETPAGMLTVNGGVTLDPTTFVQFLINGSGTTAGTDYSQLSASGAVNLAGASLGVFGGINNGKAVVCPTFNLGTADTLVTTTGMLTGTFADLPNGATTSIACSGEISTHPWVRINYTAHTVTATVVEAPQQTPSATTTALAVSNAAPTVGESVTYTATVTPEALVDVEPAGTVEFLDGGTPIGTCSAQPLTAGLSFSSANCTVTYSTPGSHTITATYAGESTYSGSSSEAQTVTVLEHASTGSGGGTGGGGTTGGSSNPVAHASSAPPAPGVGVRQTATIVSGTVTVRPKGSSAFVPLSESQSIPDESEVEATNGRVRITEAIPSGGTATAEVYGGRFRIHQERNGTTRFILSQPLTGCPRVALPRGSAASAKHSGAKSRHLWVSENGGSWGTDGRYVSTTVEGTSWLTLDECFRSQVKVTAGKVEVRDLLRKKTKTISAGHEYIASKSAKHGR